jgi:hypothetical protein
MLRKNNIGKRGSVFSYFFAVNGTGNVQATMADINSNTEFFRFRFNVRSFHVYAPKTFSTTVMGSSEEPLR